MCVQHKKKLAWWNLEKVDTSPGTFVQLYHTQTKDEARPKRNSPYLGTFPATGYMHDGTPALPFHQPGRIPDWGRECQCPAYADDMCVAASTKEKVRDLLDTCTTF